MADTQAHFGSAQTLDAQLKGPFDVRAIGEALSALAPDRRAAELRALSKRALAALYEAAKGVRRVRLTQLVPSDVPDLSAVVHQGKNSLRTFSRFDLLLCRPKRDAQELWGYNRTGGLVERTVGPGYFVAYEGPGDEMLIDYTRMPEGKPESWPEILDNRNRLGRLVYADMIDALRGVSEHVTVGRAMRGRKVLDHWFVLHRQD